MSDTTGVKLTDPVTGGKTEVSICNGAFNTTVYALGGKDIEVYKNGEVAINFWESYDEIHFDPDEIYLLHLIFKDILEKRGYALDNPV